MGRQWWHDDMIEDNSIEQRIARLERMMYLLIGLQLPNLLPYLGVL